MFFHFHLLLFLQKLEGNKDTYTAHKNLLSRPLVGVSLLRVVPYASYQRTTCLRFELYGCRMAEVQAQDQVLLPVSYTAPDGFKESSFGDLRDLTYDGRRDYYGYLNGGLGQLTDGIRGDDNYKVNYGYEWVGWRADGPAMAELSLVFQFDTFTNFSSVSFYTHNLFSKDVQVSSCFSVFCLSRPPRSTTFTSVAGFGCKQKKTA